MGHSDRWILRSPSIGVSHGTSAGYSQNERIEHLFAKGLSKRKFARTLGIARRSVDRHLADIQSKGAESQGGFRKTNNGPHLSAQEWPPFKRTLTK